MRQFNIYFDIETIPTQSDNIKNYIQSNLTAPANYKKPDSISAWLEENKEPAYRKTALNGGFGQIVCIGYAINDGDVKVIHFDNWASSEKKYCNYFLMI
ncbi:hypothetical protein [Gilliamella sp. Occ3-1]|uniref:hypothetical protein n=1 Tax=Gilliamella sp. Occ3-1 TaxID=3120253 RepID=UPI001C4008AC|nr:hypothetical protein [Gilliamella apicola]